MNAAPDPSPAPGRPLPIGSKPHWTSHVIRFRFVAFLIILGVFAWMLFGRSQPEAIAPQQQQTPEEIGQQRLAMFNGLQLSRALKEFQTKHGTDTAPYPSDIRQLDEMGITDDIRSLLSLPPNLAGHWLYFSAADSENPQAPLLLSPPLGGKQRLAIKVGGSIKIIPHAEAEKLIQNSPTPAVEIPAPVK